MAILINLLLGIWVLDALLMILVILMQRPKSEGLGAAFGGAVTENIFGAQTTNVLVKFTGWLAGIFLVLTFFLSILYAHQSSSDTALRRELMKTPPAAPQASVSPGASQPSPSVSGTSSASPAVSPNASVAATSPAASPVTTAPATSATAPAGSPSAQPKP